MTLPGARDAGAEEDKRPRPALPSAAPGGGGVGAGTGTRTWTGAGREGKGKKKKKKSPLDLPEPQGRGRGRGLRAQTVSKDSASHWGEPSELDVPGPPLQGAGEGQTGTRSRDSQGAPSRTPGVSASWIWGLDPHPPPAAPSLAGAVS